MEGKLCNCNIPRNLQHEMMFQKIQEYIERLEPEQCVSDSEYEMRLHICSGCESLVGGLTCSHCGCFVLARGKKKSSGCPNPRGNLWESDGEKGGKK